MRRGAPTRRPAGQPSTPPGAEPVGALAVRAWVRVLAVQKRALAAIRDDLEREMTMPRFDLLANVCHTDGQTLTSLSRSMLVTAGNITGLVDRAARDGMVERRADPEDRRAWRVHVTPKGRRAFRDAERRHAAKVAKLFAGLSSGELEALIRLLDKVRSTLRPADPPAVSPPRKGLGTPRRARIDAGPRIPGKKRLP